jgi:hypothetical protein
MDIVVGLLMLYLVLTVGSYALLLLAEPWLKKHKQ